MARRSRSTPSPVAASPSPIVALGPVIERSSCARCGAETPLPGARFCTLDCELLHDWEHPPPMFTSSHDWQELLDTVVNGAACALLIGFLLSL